jgi:hypothetical protein
MKLDLALGSAALAVALAACSNNTTKAGETVVSPPNEQIELPTQEELDSRADADITADEADAELEKLRNEIEGG